MRNKILWELPSKERHTILKTVNLEHIPRGSVLNEPGKPIKKAYFIDSGLVSVLNVMRDGKSIEVGLAGPEGFVGLPLLGGLKTSATKVVMLVDGTAYSISCDDFEARLSEFPYLRARLSRFSQEFMLQAMQAAACNRLHSARQSLAKWLLMSHDRLQRDTIPLLQASLAHLLGTRRATVTVAVGELQRRRLISCRRGEVQIENRRGLERMSCECYKRLSQQIDNWNN